MVPAPQQSQHGYSIHEAGDHFHNGIHQQAPQQGDKNQKIIKNSIRGNRQKSRWGYLRTSSLFFKQL